MNENHDAASRLAAKSAHLKFVSDSSPGFTREPHRGEFRFLDSHGKVIRDSATLERIRKLAIPPAYGDVWICPSENGHLQATGRDARGRKQYRYHARWRATRDESKYGRMVEFAQALPKLRKRMAADLRRPGLPKEKVLAAVVTLLDATHIRIGNDEYARTNDSFGLTTLRDKHVKIKGDTIHFRFRGKSGVAADITLRDRKLAKIVARCQDLPGQELFQYLDDAGAVRDVGSADVNEYLRTATGSDFTAKDFRTWNGTLHAAAELGACAVFASMAEAKRNVVQAVTRVAQRLNNTPSVCRKCYIHPTVIEAYLEARLPVLPKDEAPSRTLSRTERGMLAFLGAK